MPFVGPPPEKAPRAVIFDIGRVIIRVDLSRPFKQLGEHDSLTHEQVLRQLEADARWPDWQEGRMGSRDWHAHLAKKLQFSYNFDEFCGIWNSVLDPTIILPESLFEHLSGRCSIALLSNTDPIHVAHMEANFAFMRHFPSRIYSCRVGSSKPSPAIFHHALRQVGATPDEALFIDDVHDNASAAWHLGIPSFHFTSREDLLAEFSRLQLWAA